MDIKNELLIAAPVEIVWRLTIDVESWPSMTPTMSSVDRLDDGPLRPGCSARVKQPGQRAAVWTVTRVEPERCFEWETSVLGIRMIGRHQLAAVDGGTVNTLTLDLVGRGAGLLGVLVGRRVRAAIATENAGFQRRAEAVGQRR